MRTSTKSIVHAAQDGGYALGPRFLARMFEELAAGSDVPLSLHLDHCPDLELTRAVIDAGWSSVLFDASHLDLTEAAEQTTRVVSWAHPNGVDVESEIENIVGVEDGVGSDVLAGRREPLPILGEVERRVVDTVASFLELFGSAGRAGGER